MAIYDFFYKVSMAEQGGFGIWYEYLAKSRIFNKFKDPKNVLIFGLPEKYSLGLDTLFFAENSELTVLDNRMENLKDYKKYADQFSKGVKTTYIPDLKETRGLKGNRYDLLISTEVLQNDPSLMFIMKNLAKVIIIFAPNKQCYAHPRISHLNSLSLEELKLLGKEANLTLIDSGYIDCPPWPAGACLPKSEGESIKEPIYLKLVKKLLTKLTPSLSRLDSHYPAFWKQLNSHMVYCIFKNE